MLDVKQPAINQPLESHIRYIDTSRPHFYRVMVMVFNATFNNISVIPWQPILLVEETRVPRENYRPAASHWQTLSHNASFL